MAPRPYSEKSSLPADAEDPLAEIPTQIVPESPSPSTLSGATTPSPTPQEFIPVEPYVEAVNIQDNEIPDRVAATPCYPTPGDIMPYDHSLPDFIRQITNQPNLANLQSLSLRVISSLISIHRMATYMPNLRELDLEGSVLNSLRDIGCSLKNLQILKVGRCHLESLDGTFGLSSLRELYAQKNYITDVTPCSNLPHIRHIDVSGNRIRNISYAGFLSICHKLRSIVFTGNPATEVEGYRKHVRRILPQIETLDDIPFLNEDNAEECKPSELIENYNEGSDSSSTEVPDCVSVSPSESMNNFFEEEDVFLLDKKNKHARNMANQDYFIDHEEFLPELKTNIRDDFSENLNLSKSKAKGILEQAKIMENRNVKQKCIQKLDKDIENRSKKSNLMKNELKCLDERPSTSGVRKNSSGTKALKGGKMEARTLLDDCSIEGRDSGGVRKRPSTAIPKLTISENDSVAENWNTCKLTTGLPICGNLTAALRSRKKAQNAWVDEPFPEWKNIKQETDREGGKNVQVQLNGSGDNVDVDEGVENEDELIGEDVLASSKKWREAFRRFRSNNRARWEEEDDSDYSHLLGETPEICENDLPENTPTDD